MAAASMPKALYEALYADDFPHIKRMLREEQAQASRVARPIRHAAAAALSLGRRAPVPSPPLRNRVDHIGDRTPLGLACETGILQLVAWLLPSEPDAPPAPVPTAAAAAAAAAEAEEAKEEGEQEEEEADWGGGVVAADPACLNAGSL